MAPSMHKTPTIHTSNTTYACTKNQFILSRKFFSNTNTNTNNTPNNTNTTPNNPTTSDSSSSDTIDSTNYYRIKKQYNYFYQALNSTIVSKINQLTSNKRKLNIIDIACGNADTSEYILDDSNKLLLNKDEIDILGIDISKEQLQMVNKRLIASNKQHLLFGSYGKSIIFEEEDAMDLGRDYPNTFDLGVANFVYNYNNSRSDMLRMMRASYDCIKRDNGSFIIGCMPMVIGTANNGDNGGMMDVMRDREYRKELYGKYGWIHEFKEVRDGRDGSEGSESGFYRFDSKLVFNNDFEMSFGNIYSYEVYDSVAKEAGFANGVEIVKDSEFVFDNLSLEDGKMLGMTEEEKEKSIEYWTQIVQPFKLFVMRK